jgi:hypothetical protein
MTDFRKLAASIEPEIPAGDIEKAVPVLEALEKSFAPLRASIPIGAGVWTGPEDFERRSPKRHPRCGARKFLRVS